LVIEQLGGGGLDGGLVLGGDELGEVGDEVLWADYGRVGDLCHGGDRGEHEGKRQEQPSGEFEGGSDHGGIVGNPDGGLRVIGVFFGLGFGGVAAGSDR
jgi:hypothetical protein